MTEIQPESGHLAFEANVGSLGQLFGGLIRAQARFEHFDGVVHPLASLLIRFSLRFRGTADGEGPVVAGPVSDERMDDVEIRGVSGSNQPVREVVWMRTASFSRDGIDRFNAVRSHFVQALGRKGNDLAFLYSRLQRCGDVLVDAIDHGDSFLE